MKKIMSFALAALALLVIANASAVADSFLVQTGGLGYYYSITNNTTSNDFGTFYGVIANVYLVQGFGSLDGTIIQSVKPNDFQLYDNFNAVTSASGYWKDSTLMTFKATGSGQNLKCDFSDPDPDNWIWQLFYQPDNVHQGGGEFLDYDYQFTATFPTAAAYDSTWGLFLNTSAPSDITGTFSGTFQRTFDNNDQPLGSNITGDIYGFDVTFFMLDNVGEGNESTDPFGGPAVPEPGTILLVGTGLGAVCLARKRKK